MESSSSTMRTSGVPLTPPSPCPLRAVMSSSMVDHSLSKSSGLREERVRPLAEDAFADSLVGEPGDGDDDAARRGSGPP